MLYSFVVYFLLTVKIKNFANTKDLDGILGTRIGTSELDGHADKLRIAIGCKYGGK